MLTSRSFSCPSRRRYLKFGSVPQISHVAYICTEIPPRSIGCFEMDVNMNLLVIYLRPFGCLYSVAALKGHGRVFNLSWSAVIVWRSVVPHGLCVRKWVKDKAIKRFHNNTKCVDIAQLSAMLTLSNGEKHRTNVVWKWRSFMNTAKQKFPKLCASLLVTQHCGVACCPAIVVLLLLAQSPLYWRKLLLCCSCDGHVFDTFSVTFHGSSRGLSDQIKLRHESFPNIWIGIIFLLSWIYLVHFA